MLQTVYINPAKESNFAKKGEKPTITEWKGAKMIRQHSIKACVREILNDVDETGLTTISMLGREGSGKTTLAKTIGHLIHEMADEPFAIKILEKHEGILNLRNFITKLEPMNYVIVFDDSSWLTANASKQQMDEIKQTSTEIRHLPGGKDCKIILIYNYHYSKALDKYLRGTGFIFVTGVQANNEKDNLIQMFGDNYSNKISEFTKKYAYAKQKKKFIFQLGKKGYFTYNYKQPFIPLLFYDNISLRFVVSPTREWIDPICSTCENSKNEPIKSNIDLDKFAEDLDYKFGKSISRQAVRIKCFQNGVNVYPKTVKQCMQYIENYLKTKVFNLEALAVHYKFDNSPTRLDAKLPDDIKIVN